MMKYVSHIVPLGTKMALLMLWFKEKGRVKGGMNEGMPGNAFDIHFITKRFTRFSPIHPHFSLFFFYDVTISRFIAHSPGDLKIDKMVSQSDDDGAA